MNAEFEETTMFMHTGVEGKFKISLLTAAFVIAGCSSHVSQIKPVYKSPNEIRVTQESGGQNYQQGKFYFQKGQYGKAIATFERVLAKNPNSIMALNGLGASYDQLKRYQIAMRYYHRALQIDPDSSLTLNNLGFSLALQGRSERAEDVFALALSNNPDNQYAKTNKKNITSDTPESSNVNTSTTPKALAKTSTPPTPSKQMESVEIDPTQQTLETGEMTLVDTVSQNEPIAAMPVNEVTDQKVQAPEDDALTLAANSEISKPAPSVKVEEVTIIQQPEEGFLVGGDIEVQPAIILSHEISVDTTWADSKWADDSDLETTHEVTANSSIASEEEISSQSASIYEVTIDTGWADSEWIDKSDLVAVPEMTAKSTTGSVAVALEDPSQQAASYEVDIDTGWADIKWIDEEVAASVVESAPAPIEEAGGTAQVLQPENSFVVRIVSDATEESRQAVEEAPQTITLSQEAVTPRAAFRLPIDTEIHRIAKEETRPLLFGPTKRGHTLWDISLQLSNQQGSDHSQMLTALAYSNPEAFINGDMNLLKVGYMLWVPKAEEIADTSVPALDTGEGVLGNLAVEVSNGNGRRGIANMIANYLQNKGAEVARITNAEHYQMQVSIIYYTAEHQEEAMQLAEQLPIKPILKKADKAAEDASVRLVLGKDLLDHESEIRKVFLNQGRV